jgi:hypothetical protein
MISMHLLPLSNYHQIKLNLPEKIPICSVRSEFTLNHTHYNHYSVHQLKKSKSNIDIFEERQKDDNHHNTLISFHFYIGVYIGIYIYITAYIYNCMHYYY